MSSIPPPVQGTVVINGNALRPDHVAAVAHGARVVLGGEARQAMDLSARAFGEGTELLEGKRRQLLGTRLQAAGSSAADPRGFILSHCSAVGAPLPVPLARALLVCRANVLAVGASGVRPETVQRILDLLNAGITPVIPSQGSVGAAGDLAPLAHAARVYCGLGGAAILPDGTRTERVDLRAYGLRPVDPTPKEALALINGATLTAAMGAMAVFRAQRVRDALVVACGMTMEALQADLRCLSPGGIALRGHSGGERVARELRSLLAGSELAYAGRTPDPFSLRAAPAVIGALTEAIDHVAGIVIRELNGACDNPIWIEDEGVVEVGNFHGAPVALALDYLRAALTQAITQSERRTYRLCTGHLVGDLPSFLVEGTGLNSGLMIAQYTAASLASECKGLSHPAVVDSIPTVQHSEDHVSMGPIAGRLTLRVLECCADIVGIEALFAAQALDFRRAGVRFHGGQRLVEPPLAGAPGVETARKTVREVVQFWEDDQILEPCLAATSALIRSGRLPPHSTPDLPW